MTVFDEASFLRNQRALHEALKSTILAKLQCAKDGREDDVVLINVMQYAILFNADLTCLLRDLEHSVGFWHANIHARQLALTTLECAKGFKSLLGRPLRTVVRGWNPPDEAVDYLGSLHREIVLFYDTHGEAFERLRNAAVAHRDMHAPNQIGQILTLDSKAVEESGWELVSWTNRVHDLCRALLTFSRTGEWSIGALSNQEHR